MRRPRRPAFQDYVRRRWSGGARSPPQPPGRPKGQSGHCYRRMAPAWHNLGPERCVFERPVRFRLTSLSHGLPCFVRLIGRTWGCRLPQSRVRNAVAPRTVAKTVINEITIAMNGWKIIGTSPSLSGIPPAPRKAIEAVRITGVGRGPRSHAPRNFRRRSGDVGDRDHGGINALDRLQCGLPKLVL